MTKIVNALPKKTVIRRFLFVISWNFFLPIVYVCVRILVWLIDDFTDQSPHISLSFLYKPPNTLFSSFRSMTNKFIYPFLYNINKNSLHRVDHLRIQKPRLRVKKRWWRTKMKKNVKRIKVTGDELLSKCEKKRFPFF